MHSPDDDDVDRDGPAHHQSCGQPFVSAPLETGGLAHGSSGLDQGGGREGGTEAVEETVAEELLADEEERVDYEESPSVGEQRSPGDQV